jgi:hypothetical protein
VINQKQPALPDRPPKKCDGHHIRTRLVQADELSLNVPATTGSGAIGDNLRHRQSIAMRSAPKETHMNRSAKAIIAATIGILGLSATSALAETLWDRHHPRRDQVNDRIENQDRRINHEFREGELTPWQAGRLHQEDRTIRHEERAMASFDHGHITRNDERALNQQENAVSGQIGR